MTTSNHQGEHASRPAATGRLELRGAAARAVALAAVLLGPPGAASADPAAADSDAVAQPAEKPSEGADARPVERPLPPPPPRWSPPAPPRTSPLEVVGRAMSVGGLITATVGAAVLTVALFSGSTACAAASFVNGCEESSNEDLVAGGAITLTLGGLIVIGGVVLTEVATPGARPSATSFAPQLVGAPGGAGLGWTF